MKQILSAFAFVASVATIVAITDDTPSAWLGKEERDPDCGLQPASTLLSRCFGFFNDEEEIAARCINCGGESYYAKGEKSNGEQFFVPNGNIKRPNQNVHPFCEDSAGIDIGQIIYCGFTGIGFQRYRNTKARMILYFNGLKKGDHKCRVVIPISELTPEESMPEYMDDPSNRIHFIDRKTIEQIPSGQPFPFSLGWLDDLGRLGLRYTCKPLHPGDKAHGADTYVSRNVRLPQNTMKNLLSAI